MSTLGIIGTAGRSADASRLTKSHWRMMCCIGQTICVTNRVDHLVSGGSAYADHVAVQLYLDGVVKHLSLYLPAAFQVGEEAVGGVTSFEHNVIGNRLNDLHDAFLRVTEIDPFEQLEQAVERGAKVTVNPGGFKARNTQVAEASDTLLAFTFGPIGNEGGTADTVSKYLKRRELPDPPEPVGDFITPTTPKQAALLSGRGYLPLYHFDLTSKRLTSL